VIKTLKKRRLRVAHADAVIIAEAPKISTHKEEMRANIASELGLPLTGVGLKAKTNERFDAVGRRQAIICHAIVSLAPAGKGRKK